MIDWSKIESPLDRQKREGDEYLAEMKRNQVFPKPERPPTHENTLRLYQFGLLSAGLIRHLAEDDDLLALKADRLGVPSKVALEKELRNDD